ncbi:MAG: S-methyl-5-thioribose-1-phosphate isomerase [candidate division KSB1 bacterium]|nr:S-methyl-5-thioribose-1-phosphate isomerase [candidate division KSB1 bacterium]
MPVTTIEWIDDHIRLIDQTRLPTELVYLDIDDLPRLAEAIQSLRVRGAPALGIAAAFGLLLIAHRFRGEDAAELLRHLRNAADLLRRTRPTAVNLGWALDQMLQVAEQHIQQPVAAIRRALHDKAMTLFESDRQVCRQIGEHGAGLIPDGAQIVTHCNTGALATVDWGTALGAIFTAHAQGKKLHVWVDETRPLLQGARLTMWELMHEGIDATLICDNTAAFVMQQRKIDLCIVGADRIATNGDTANKIGTYHLAVAAKHHGIPFYVAAPISTIDFTLDRGEQIPIEKRAAEEVTHGFGRQTAPEGASVYSPAFDITPNELITAIITEVGVLYPPFREAIPQLAKNT